MSRHAQYAIEKFEAPAGSSPSITIRDLGPWDLHLTVTNDAEFVVEQLVASGRLPAGARLFYFDSEGVLDELLVVDSKFAGFAPGPDGNPTMAVPDAL